MAEAREKLAKQAQALPSVQPKDLANFLIETQKLRVLCMLLAESEGDGKSDPNTYREMSMLSRMLAVAGPGEEPGVGEDLVAEEEARARLMKRGISKEAVPQMVRILSALSGRAAPPPPLDEDEGDEPDMKVN